MCVGGSFARRRSLPRACPAWHPRRSHPPPPQPICAPQGSLGGEEPSFDEFVLHSEASEDVCSVSRSSTHHPSTPSTASLPDAVAALQGRLEATSLLVESTAAGGGSATS